MDDTEKTRAQLIEELRKLRESADREREAQEALRQTRERYRSLVESTDDSIYVVGPENQYVFMNRIHRERLGIHGTEYVGKTYADFHNEEETGIFTEKVRTVLATGRSLQYQHRSLRNGKYYLRTLSPIRGPGGDIEAVTIVSKDINELKRAEVERDRIIFELQDALAQIKTLKGLIPICAWCKKIRDDSGYWQKIETYIKE
ncbi:MAG: PAS domain-containing protein, partial [Gammaproteobacteria bacterium]|nr:PAS domain-containing protein [Gammaproteobacteria bacterium]